MRVQAIKRARVEVTADGDGVVGHAGALLLSELATGSGCLAGWTAGQDAGSRRGSGTGAGGCWPMWR